MWSDQKTFFLKNEDIGKKQVNFLFLLIRWTIVVPKAKIGF
jgi:hypothetical protein